ncbi:MAG TPA: SMP-30/gluconolactonase/LRE family protein [Solirubrobacteraceae bacterium]|nr:SMP-30/gluconolactonase/LRE family protein [Solirubrobacteraceae bacterium]
MVAPGLRTIADGLDHPESICWSAGEQRLYAGGEAGQIYRFALADGPPELVATIDGGVLLGLALDGAGRLYACDPTHGCVHRVQPDGRVDRYGDAIGYPNYPAFDDQGRLWVSDSGGWEDADGAIVRIDPDGATERVAAGLRFANGVAIRDGWLYVVESAWPGVVRLPLDGGDVEAVVGLERVVPDGLAFDADGGLWIGCWQPNRVYRRGPAGTLDVVVDDWSGEYVFTPTNLAFAGPQLDVLVLASLGGQSVKAIAPGVCGAPLTTPALVAA